jgi:hypothetical protein
MSKIKVITIVLLIAMLVALPAGKALAASGSDTTIGTGSIVSIKIETDLSTLTSTVVVTLLDSAGLAQTMRVSLESAISLGLVIPNELMLAQDVSIVDKTDATIIIASGVVNSLMFVTDPTTLVTTVSINLTTDPILLTARDFIVDLDTAVFNEIVATNELLINTEIVVDPTLIIDSSTFGKVISKLGAFFASNLGVDFATLEAYQAEGYGYGVITQASWMAYLLGGDADTLAQILAAKSSGDYSGIVLADESTATNWGQLRQAVLTDGKQNMGQIISGKADPVTATTTITTTTTTTTKTNNDNGNSNANSNANGNADTHGNSNKNKP